MGAVSVAVMISVCDHRLARRERRFSRRDSKAAPAADFLGRTVTAMDEAELKRASYIEVHLVESPDDPEAPGHKVFRASGKAPD